MNDEVSGRRRLFPRPLLGAIGGAAALTLAGRAVGLLSQTLVASHFGAGMSLDAFFIAILVPGLLIAPLEGAVEAIIAPKIAGQEAAESGRSWALQAVVLRRAVYGGILLGGAATVASPILVRASAPSASRTSLDLAGALAVIAYPAIAARVVTAACSGILFGRGQLRTPLAVQIVNPLAIVVALGVFEPTPRTLTLAAAIGWVLEAVVLTGLVVAGRAPRLLTSKSAGASVVDLPGARALGLVVLSYVLSQISPTVDQIFASGLGEGRLATFIIAVRLFEVSASLLILPTVRLVQNQLGGSTASTELFKRRLRQSMRVCLAAGVVAAVALEVAGPFIVDFAFERGAFTSSDAAATVEVTRVIALALVPSAVGYVLSRSLVVLELQRALAGAMAVQIVVNVALNGLLIGPFGGPGLAASTVVTYVVGDALMYRRIARHLASSDPAVVPELELEDRPQRGRRTSPATLEPFEEQLHGRRPDEPV